MSSSSCVWRLSQGDSNGTGEPHKRLLIFGFRCDTRFKDSDQWTALHHAAGEGHTKIVEFLIQECKVNLEEVDEFNAPHCGWLLAMIVEMQ